MSPEEIQDLIQWLRDRSKIESVIHGRSECDSRLAVAADLIEALFEDRYGGRQ